MSRTDVLLVYPPWVRKRGRGALQRTLPPLGVLSIAAYLEHRGLSVRVVDIHAERLTPEAFAWAVGAMKPRCVGISVLSPHESAAHQAARICKRVAPGAVVVAGGVHADAFPDRMLRNPHIDAVGRGDGEELMLELACGRPFGEIAGLSYREAGRVRHNPPRPVEMNLDRYPFPAYHLVDLRRYFPAAGTYLDLPAINVLMTRGCPGKCTFCNSAQTPLRGRSAEKMVELISWLSQKHGVRHVYFYDDTFTADPRRVRDFCARMLEGRVEVGWTCYARGDMFPDSLAALMARAGCRQVLFGVESGNLALTQAAGKGIEREKYRLAVETAHRYGIEVRGSFIIGHPGETRQTMEETLRFAMDIDLDFFQLSLMTPYPGTQLFRHAQKEGLLVHEDFSRYGQSEAVLKLENLTPRDLEDFERKAFRRFYLRPKIALRQARRLSRLAQLKDLLQAFHVFLLGGQGDASGPPMEGWLAPAFDPSC